MSVAFDPWGALAKIREGGLASLGGLGGLGGGHPAKPIFDPAPTPGREDRPAPCDPAAPDDYREAQLEGAKLRPPCWPMTYGAPPAGARCTMCGGDRWWHPAEPRDDGLGPSAHWRCAVCHPPPARCDAREALS